MVKLLAGLIYAGLLTGLLGACADSNAPEPVSASATPTAFGTCRREMVQQHFQEVIEAFNRGDQPTLARHLPGPNSPYSIVAISFNEANPSQNEQHVRFRDREPLLAYLAGRHERHERWQLQDFSVHYMRGRPDQTNVGFGYNLVREADDLSQRVTAGKGEMICQDGLIYVWNQ